MLILFWSPRGADDVAVHQEVPVVQHTLGGKSRSHYALRESGRLVRHGHHMPSQVNQTPTLLIVNNTARPPRSPASPTLSRSSRPISERAAHNSSRGEDPTTLDRVSLAGPGFAQHLQRPLARGHVADGPHTGAAGGAACGDLIRISLSLDPEDPTAASQTRASTPRGCGAAIAAGSAVVALLATLRCCRPPASGPSRSPPSSAASARPSATPPSWPPTRCTARSAPLRASAPARPRPPGRTLVAMSGGVDSRRRRAARVRIGRRTVAVTLELWADPGERRRSQLLLGPGRPRRPRARSRSRRAPPLDRPARRVPRRRRRAWLTAHAAGLTPNPCVRCNGSVRLDAMLELADRLGADARDRSLRARHQRRFRVRRTLHHGRAHEEPTQDGPTRGPLLRIAADEAKDQSYALAALSPASLARLRFPLGELTKPQVRAIAERAGLPVASRPDSQDLCFLAGTGQRDFLARHADLASVPADPRSRGALRGRASRCHAHRCHAVASVGRGLGRDRRSRRASVCAGDRCATSNTITVGPRVQLLTRTVPVRDVTLHRDGARGRRRQGPLSRRAVALPYRRRCRGRGARARSSVELRRSPPSAPPRVRSRVCMRTT